MSPGPAFQGPVFQGPVFQGRRRFETRRLLGQGTAGVVYEAWDHQRGCSVALKLLHQGDPAALYRFKQEFRALAHLSHPNLIQLHELQHENNQWFVIMELIDGVDFVRYVRDPQVLKQGHEVLEDRLRKVTRQLALGLRALHVSGRLHRDIKPSNVLVTGEGRVVILDFGLVTKATTELTFKSFTEDILGTPAYMAPEQGSGENLSQATDWYGVGTLMYEALTGDPPFKGQFVTVMLSKQTEEPPPPKQLVPEISPDLDDLCWNLLRRQPKLRLEGAQVLERLGAVNAIRQPSPSHAPPVLIGRDESMRQMWNYFDQVLAGEPVVLYVHGESGLGKTVLVQHFLLEMRRKHRDAVTLSGRCYEHESVPYKAFDSIVDMLTRYLRSLPDEQVPPLLPRDVLVLARLFPVLRRVAAIADAKRQVLEIPDSLELRRRAYAALREVLTRLAEDHPLVLFIDDLQWGDYDSASLLSTILRSPNAPPLMLIAAFRGEDEATSPLIRELRPKESSLHMLPGEDLVVRELNGKASRQLARQLLDTNSGVTPTDATSPDAAVDSPADSVAEKIAGEAHGNPLFIAELVHHTLMHGRVAQGGLDEVFRVRMAQLPSEARQLLEVLAVAAGPIEVQTARRAAGLEPSELAALSLLRIGNLVRSIGGQEGDQIEIFHDRVRKAVMAEIDPSRRRARHQHLARELESDGRADTEALAHHFAEAGENARALEYMTQAAESSVRSLAFNRAARLYRRALDLQACHEDQERILLRNLAETLVHAGRGPEAAESYLLLAEGAPRGEAREARRLAAERLLVSGHVDRGLEVLQDVLPPLGWKLADNPRQALPGLLLRRAWRRLRGYRFRQRDAALLSAEELNRIDTCWSATLGLTVVDTLRAAAFQARHLELALAAGEPFRLARALALETIFIAAAGAHTARRTTKLLALANQVADQVDDPYIPGFLMFADGLAAYLQGRWKKALRSFEKARTIFRDRCSGVAWEIDHVHFYTLLTLGQLGRVHELVRRLPIRLKEARERGDLHTWTGIRTRGGWLVDLAADEPERADSRLVDALAAWTPRGFHLARLWCLMGRAEVALYAGDGRRAWELLQAQWGAIESSFLLHVETISVECYFLRGRAALAAAGEVDGASPVEFLSSARRDARRIAKRPAPWSDPTAEMLLAGIAGLRGLPDVALRHITAAEKGFTLVDMSLHGEVARFRRGELLAGEEGRELRRSTSEWMTRQGIQNPPRMVRQMSPNVVSLGASVNPP